ncbi:uncharacterized protein N7500_002034 [Penicillium coprophilum]|uniref:uncharacterized protein n=1 Tax=Penicillium coprophilum TaxID=36646 RepID=UPI0023920E88|nr:uncharacterized protein N7500_002034 [Penicillium coprophilum]KAJ5174103.1 hypothetical protein N7500_002034 [Penicillium coprophilum]
MRTRMCFDDVAWERSEAIQDAWVHELFKEETLMAIGEFVLKYRRGVPIELCDPKAGAFNVSFRMKFEDGGSAIIRFPKPGATMFPDEKVRNEVDIIRYIQQHTTIPVPFVLHWGTKEENPLGLGPFIIMEYIDHVMDLSDVLNTPGFTIKDRPILDPHVDDAKLELLYGQFADILLQLSTLRLPRIGSLVQTDDFTWEVAQRPLSYNANELVRLGTLPRSKLPRVNETFQSALSYFNKLADLHLDHLTYQQNDAIDSADDCRRRYIARLLFRKLAKDGRFTTSSTDLGPFNIWCDDLRPSNVLINEHLQIVGVVDWDFTYAAPVEFSHAPPWWLLLEQPEYWPDGVEAWTKVYESRLQTFLKVLREQEDMAIDRGRLKDEQRLSTPMQQSWESGDFWVTYAARKNFAFDAVFWKKLDGRFFGPGTSTDDDRWKERIDLLTEDERANMEKVVEEKLEETTTRVLAWEPDEVDLKISD